MIIVKFTFFNNERPSESKKISDEITNRISQEGEIGNALIKVNYGDHCLWEIPNDLEFESVKIVVETLYNVLRDMGYRK